MNNGPELISNVTSGPPALNRPVWQSLATITLVALALRLVAVRFLYTDTWNDFENHLLFGFETGRIARSIAAGHGYANPMLVETGPTAWMTPIYPYLLAGVFKLFGIYSEKSALAILSVNSLFSALICIPVFYITQRSFGRSVAVAASWLWALWPYSIYIAGAFVWETCLSALLLAILFLWSLKLNEQPAPNHIWLGFGMLWGLSALTNSSTLSLFPFLTAWALSPLWKNRQRWFSSAALATFGLILVLLPWQIRNYRTFHTPIPLRDNFWLEVWIGNDGHTESWLDSSAHPSINANALAEFVRLGEIPFMQEKRREALGFIARHPAQFLVTSLRRGIYMWTAFWNLDPANLEIELHNPGNIYLTALLTIVMLIGLWQAFRTNRRAALPYALVLLIYPLVYYVTHPEIRYRHMIDPEIIVLAAVGLRFVVLEFRKDFPSLEPRLRRRA
ncbi:MAG: glycosyltransferase family 39 protein [Candidatus Acidiferrales bacterium]